MLRRLVSCTALVALFGYAPRVVALDAPTPTTWEECVRWTATNSPELKAAVATLRAAQDTTRSNIGGYFPVITATAGINRTEQDTVNPTTTPEFSDSNSASAMLNFTQNLFNGFGDVSRVKQARSNEKLQLDNLRLAQAKVSADLKTAFAGVLYARQSIDLTARITERRRQNLALVQLRYEGGRENKGSVMLYQAYLKDASYNHLVATDFIDSAEAIFAKTAGLEPADVKVVKGQIPDVAPPLSVDFRSLIVDNPNHTVAVANEDVQRAGIGIARANLLPTLNLTGSAGRVDSVFFPENPQWTIGLGLTIPIFNGGHDYYGVRAAENSLASASASVELADRLLIMNLKQAYYAYIEAIEKQAVDQTYLQAARVRADIGRNKYDNGLLTFEDWDLIETDLINRETNALNSARNRFIQEAAWEQAQGRGVFQ